MLRVFAGLWLACLGGPGSPGLDDSDPQARKAALYALGPAGIRAELEVVMALAKADPEPTVRRLAMGLLGPTGDPRVVPLLEAGLQNWDDTGEQLTAATALGNVRHADSCAVLIDAFILWPTERDPVYEALRSALLLSDPVCNQILRDRKPERRDRIGGVLLEISRRH